MNKELEQIKKIYGEHFAKLCRSLFPTILEEQEGKLLKILTSHFAPTKALYQSIIDAEKEGDFKNFIYSLANHHEEVIESNNDFTAVELLAQYGYTLYECKTDKEIQSFKKYYAHKEEICTFRTRRLSDSRVFFVVKNDVENYRREDYETPKREDEYSTSVMSIQFTHTQPSSVKIISRYNHACTDGNPDIVFKGDLDAFIPGLKSAFCRDYGIKLNSSDSIQFELDNFVLGFDGQNTKFYHKNFELLNINFCENNIIIDGTQVKEFKKDRYIVCDNYIIDKSEKRIFPYMDYSEIFLDEDYRFGDDYEDAFVKSIGEIDYITEKTTKFGREVIITPKEGKDIIIGLDKSNNIISYENENATELGDLFLPVSEKIQKIIVPNVEYVGDLALNYAVELMQIDLSKAKHIGNQVLTNASQLRILNADNVEIIGDDFASNCRVENVYLPKAVHIGNRFMEFNNDIISFDADSLEYVGKNFIGNGGFKLEQVSAESLRYINDYFLSTAEQLTEISLPNAEIIERGFMSYNINLERFYAPKCTIIGDDCLSRAKKMKTFNLDNVEVIGDDFLSMNLDVLEANFPKVRKIGDRCLANNRVITKVNAPQLIEAGDYFLAYAEILEKANFLNLEVLGDNVLENAINLRELYMPAIRVIGNNFGLNAINLEKLDLSTATIIGRRCLDGAINLKYLDISSVKSLGDNCLWSQNRENQIDTIIFPEIMQEFSLQKMSDSSSDEFLTMFNNYKNLHKRKLNKNKDERSIQLGEEDEFNKNL